MSEKKRTDGAQPTAVVVGVGAERGLGAALCRRFATAGHHVFVAGRTAEKLDVVVRQIKAGGGSAEAVTMDGTKEADVIALFDRAMSPAAGKAPADITPGTIERPTSASSRGASTSSTSKR